MPASEIEANAASAYILFYARHDVVQSANLDFQKDLYPLLLQAARGKEQGSMSEEEVERLLLLRRGDACAVQ